MNPKTLLCLALVLIGGLLGWPFEIMMEGFDRYYRKEWFPQQTNRIEVLKTAPPDLVALAIDDFYDSKDRAYVARRLWQGDKFRGLASDEMREVVEYGHYTEEFLSPVSREHFPNPCVIKWMDGPSRIITYTIENVEFTYQHMAGHRPMGIWITALYVSSAPLRRRSGTRRQICSPPSSPTLGSTRPTPRRLWK